MGKITNQRVRPYIFILCIIIALLFIAESFLRILKPAALQYYRNIKLLHVFNPDYMVGLAPNVSIYIRHFKGRWEGNFTTNSLGYRGSPEVDKNRSQIGCLGDSIVMGFGVSDKHTFCSLLNNIKIGKERFQTMNLGVDAFGSLGSAKRLKEAAKQLNIKKALFFISPNDFTMSPGLRSLGQKPDDEKESLRDRNPGEKFWFRLQFEMTRISYLLHALKLSFEHLRIKNVQNKEEIRRELIKMGLLTDDQNESATGNNNLMNYIRTSFYARPQRYSCRKRKKRDSILINERPKKETIKALRQKYCPAPLARNIQCMKKQRPIYRLNRLPDETQKAYQFMISIARANKIQLIPVLLPIQDKVIQCTQNRKYSRLFDYALRSRRYFIRNKIPVIDLRKHVWKMCGEPIKTASGDIRASRPEDYYIRGDGHFTIMGNRWVAKALRIELKKMSRNK